MKLKEEQESSYLEGLWSTVMHLPETLWTERTALTIARLGRVEWKRKGEECVIGLVGVVGKWLVVGRSEEVGRVVSVLELD